METTYIVQGHRPFRRDCRACVLDMANGPQHRRRAFGGASAWSLGVDIVQFGKTRDAVTDVDVKYAVVATALVPRFETPETDEDGKIHPHEKVEIPDWGEGLNEEEFPLDGVREDSEKEIDDPDEKSPKMEPFLGEDEPPKGGKIDPSKYPKNGQKASVSIDFLGSDEKSPKMEPFLGKIRDEVEKCSKPLSLCHVTMVEPISSRGTAEVLRALTLLLVKMKSLGIHVYRLHGDRAKELLSHKMEQWCNQHGIIRTLGGGGGATLQITDMLSRKPTKTKGQAVSKEGWSGLDTLAGCVETRHGRKVEEPTVFLGCVCESYASVCSSGGC